MDRKEDPQDLFFTPGGLMESMLKIFLKEIEMHFEAADIQCPNAQPILSENSLAVYHSVTAILSPRNTFAVQAAVRAANKYGISLYPVSRGKNIGYGEQTPYESGQVILNLSHLCSIREIDTQSGEVVIEPGVTQGQLAQFLKDRGVSFWADMTGAPVDASVVGNTLEGGFGHTPLGDHRKHILQAELVLADGTMMTTPQMPALGPDLGALIVQSNFAVVTALRIPLFPIPKRCVTYVLSFDTESEFLEGVGILSQLRTQGVINSLVHAGNALRTLMTSEHGHQNLTAGLTDYDALQILNKNNPLKAGAWTAVGALYGFPAEVQEKAKLLKQAMKKTARVRFFTDRKMKIIEKALNNRWALKIKSLSKLRKSFDILRMMHGLLRGQPSNQPTEHTLGGIPYEKLGWAWFSPVVPAKEQDISLLLSVVRSTLAKYGFLAPITLTLISNKKMTAVISLSFDRSNPVDVKRAHVAYAELAEACQKIKFAPYRLGILSQAEKSVSKESLRVLNSIKKALDPNNTLAPGRYGIGSLKEKSIRRIRETKELGFREPKG